MILHQGLKRDKSSAVERYVVRTLRDREHEEMEEFISHLELQ